MSNDLRKKVSSKADIKPSNFSEMDQYSEGMNIPADILAELKAANLVGRFVSIREVNAGGGYHKRGWTPYQLKTPRENIINGQMDKVFRKGDLILAVKTAEAHAAHKKHLSDRARAQSQSHKNNVKEMRDRIRDGRADKHISLFEGYEENGDKDE